MAQRYIRATPAVNCEACEPRRFVAASKPGSQPATGRSSAQ
jgi:hypothetical protein